MDIATRLDLAMRAAELDQSECARRSGISPSTINRILSGRIKSVSAEHAAKLAKACGVSLAWLILGEENAADTHFIKAVFVNHQEMEFLKRFRALSKLGRDWLLSALNARARDENQDYS